MVGGTAWLLGGWMLWVRGREVAAFVALLGVQAALTLGAWADRLPQEAGWVGLALHVWTMLLPLVFFRLRDRAMVAGDRAAGIRWIRVLRWLQPGFPHALPEDPAAALSTEALAEAWRQERRPELASALMWRAVGAQRWDEVVRWADELPGHGGLNAPIVARARAERGDLGGARQALVEAERVLASVPALRHGVQVARLQVLAHHGAVDEVEALLRAPSLDFLDAATGDIWRGVARSRRGDASGAARCWERARAGGERVRLAAERRLADPPGPVDLAAPAEVVDAARLWAPVPSGTAPFVATAPASAVLIGVIAIVHLLVERGGSTTDPAHLLDWGANVAALSLSAEPWRLVTAVFLHAGWAHLAMNAAGLLFVGRDFEARHGAAATWAVFLVSGVLGAAASAAWRLGTPQVSVGASAAIMGLVGADAVGLAWRRWPRWYRRRELIGVALIVGGTAALGLTSLPVDHAGHFSGLAAGLLVAALLLALPRLSVLLGAVGLLATAGAAAALVLSVPEPVTVASHGLVVEAPPRWVDISEDGLVLSRPGAAVVGLDLVEAQDVRSAALALGEDLARHLEGLEADGGVVTRRPTQWATVQEDFAHVSAEVTLYGRELRYAAWVAEIDGGHVGAIGWYPAVDPAPWEDAIARIVRGARRLP